MITKIETYDFWDDVIDYYFDHIWPDEHGMPSIVNWVEETYNCKMDGNVAMFRNSADATMFRLRWS